MGAQRCALLVVLALLLAACSPCPPGYNHCGPIRYTLLFEIKADDGPARRLEREIWQQLRRNPNYRVITDRDAPHFFAIRQTRETRFYDRRVDFEFELVWSGDEPVIHTLGRQCRTDKIKDCAKQFATDLLRPVNF